MASSRSWPRARAFYLQMRRFRTLGTPRDASRFVALCRGCVNQSSTGRSSWSITGSCRCATRSRARAGCGSARLHQPARPGRDRAGHRRGGPAAARDRDEWSVRLRPVQPLPPFTNDRSSRVRITQSRTPDQQTRRPPPLAAACRVSRPRRCAQRAPARRATAARRRSASSRLAPSPLLLLGGCSRLELRWHAQPSSSHRDGDRR